MKIVLATHNKNKIIEIKSSLSDTGIEILSLDDFPNMPDVVENGTTLAENSLKKAKEIFEYTKITALADDTGLEVTYLNGAPGIYSARYAGEDCSYHENCVKLLKALEKADNREAQFKTVATLYGKNILETTNGIVTGKIISNFIGKDGFGYDPIFIPDNYDITFAEMSLSEKNKISHRGKAIKKMTQIIKNLS